MRSPVLQAFGSQKDPPVRGYGVTGRAVLRQLVGRGKEVKCTSQILAG